MTIVGFVLDKIQWTLCWTMCKSQRHHLCWSGAVIIQLAMGRTVL